ncbi:MAG TPA: hypothetical protein VK203_14335 [Nostocaceae cyanobacterium]|nr:hypothetical protein [Nostocaceae cyanobacterium]
MGQPKEFTAKARSLFVFVLGYEKPYYRNLKLHERDYTTYRHF